MFFLTGYKMLSHFRLFPFLAGIVLGFIVLKYYQPPAHTIFEYPHPDNVVNRFYRDRNAVCYKYNSKEVNCNENELTLKQYPLQN